MQQARQINLKMLGNKEMKRFLFLKAIIVYIETLLNVQKGYQTNINVKVIYCVSLYEQKR